MNSRRQTWTVAYLFLLPFLVTIAVFFFYAFARAIYFSFSNYNLFNTPTLIGLKPYADVLGDPQFRRALANTLLYSVIVTVLQTIFALLMAVILNRKIRGLSFFRSAWYMPSITSSVVITSIFLWLFQRRGLVNYLITQLQSVLPFILTFVGALVVLQVLQVLWERRQRLPAGWFDPALMSISTLLALVITAGLGVLGVVQARALQPVDIQYFSDRWFSVGGVQILSYPLMVVIIQNIFTTVPNLMLFFLAGLQGVPAALYEAAEIDGATPVQQLLNITVPMLRPVTFFVVTVSLIGTLQMFDQVAIIGATAPTDTLITLAYYVYRNTFQAGVAPVNLASAAAIILALITLALVYLQRRFFVSSEAQT